MKTPIAYDLIVQSEDKSRSLVETLIYALLILSVVVSILRFAVQPVIVPDRIAANEAQTEFRA
jgi:hypothetical protein